MTKENIAKIERIAKCDMNHSGSKNLTYHIGYFQCAGCGKHHSLNSVIAKSAYLSAICK